MTESLNIYKQAEKNITKTWFLMFGFLFFVTIVGWLASVYFEDPSILYYATGFSVFTNGISFFFSDKAALASTGARLAKRKNPIDLKLIRAVENMSITAGIPTPKIYLIDDESMNAFATGRGPEHSSVVASTGLVSAMEKAELEGVIAHEISHIKNRDILVMSLVVVLVGFIVIISDLFRRGMFRNNKRNNILMIAGFALALIAPIFAKIIQMTISRKREYLADASGAHLTRYPEGLASALEKIKMQNLPMKNTSSATAHLFISSPFANKKISFFDSVQNLFSTHPPIDERIRILRSMK